MNQDPIGLLGGDNLYEFSPNINSCFDPLGLSPRNLRGIASGSCNSIGKKWLKGTHGNAGVFIEDAGHNVGTASCSAGIKDGAQSNPHNNPRSKTG